MEDSVPAVVVTLRYKFDATMEEHYQILKYVTINGSNTVGEIPKKNKNDTTTLYMQIGR